MKQFMIAILVDNQFGVLSRISGMFSRRGFNIDSLTVGETENPELSRMTITMSGDDYARDQIIKQLAKLEDVKEIEEMESEKTVSRELLLLKVRCSKDDMQPIMNVVNVFRCNTIDFSTESICIEVTGASSKIDALIDLMRPFGIIEMCRTGAVALARGTNSLNKTK